MGKWTQKFAVTSQITMAQQIKITKLRFQASGLCQRENYWPSKNVKLWKGNACKNSIIFPWQITCWCLMNYLRSAPVFCFLFPQFPHKTGSLFKFDRNTSGRPACHCCFQGWHPIWQIQRDQPFKTRNLLWMVLMCIYCWFLRVPMVHILWSKYIV